jgi:RNA polymerase sigma-70 factor (ECF subfamily)
MGALAAAAAMEAALDLDLALVERTLAGDQDAFRGLVERYQDRMFSLVKSYARNSVEVEDIVQDTFLKAYTKLATFGRQSSFYTWLCRIAINTSLDFLKRSGRNPVQVVEDPELPGEALSQRARGVSSPDARMEQEEIATITERVLASMPEIFRTVLVLREFEDLSYQEIADCLGISIGTVESRLFRARARFRDKLIALHPEFDAEAFAAG